MNHTEKSVLTDGFLAEAVDNWRKVHKRRACDWFELAYEMNKFGHEVKFIAERKGHPPAKQHLFAGCLLYLRSLTTFQASIRLAEYGLVVDSQTLIRSCLENLFFLVMLKENPKFVASMIKSDVLQEKKKLDGFLKLPPDLGLNEKRTEKIKSYLGQLPNDLSAIQFIDIAQKAGLSHMYNTYYRGLSHIAAHPNIQALKRHISYDQHSNPKGYLYGPDASNNDLGSTVAYACSIFHCTTKATLELFPDEALHSKNDSLFERYSKLAHRDFPNQFDD